jgi:acetoin utilization deacetylase AcuC-like enzyme
LTRTAWIWDERLMWHEASLSLSLNVPEILEPYEHWEAPATKRRFRNLVEASGLLGHLRGFGARPAAREELERVHSAEYLDRVIALNPTGGDAGVDATFGPGGFDLAAASAGGCLVAVDAVLSGQSTNAYGLVRPPGHHAEPDRGRGFCILSNVAIAARHAQAQHGVGRIAIVDWDVHHGNGTEAAFYDDPSVLTVSVHQHHCFPLDSGGAKDRGAGDGEGFNVNVPLPPGSGTEAYLHAFERIVLPALYTFRPELILVSCGLDANVFDPMARMMLHSDSFRTLTRSILDVATDLCEDRLVMCHEGGYSAVYVPFCGLAVVEELAGHRTQVVDPFLAAGNLAVTGQPLLPHQSAAIEEAAGVLDLRVLVPPENPEIRVDSGST